MSAPEQLLREVEVKFVIDASRRAANQRGLSHERALRLPTLTLRLFSTGEVKRSTRQTLLLSP